MLKWLENNCHIKKGIGKKKEENMEKKKDQMGSLGSISLSVLSILIQRKVSFSSGECRDKVFKT